MNVLPIPTTTLFFRTLSKKLFYVSDITQTLTRTVALYRCTSIQIIASKNNVVIVLINPL